MEKTCLKCQQTFVGRPDQLFCTGNCKVRNFRSKQKQHRIHTSIKGIENIESQRAPKSDVEIEAALEMKRLELAHEEKILRLEYEQSEKSKQQELIESERRYQHELELNEISSTRELQSLREEVKNLLIRNEAAKIQPDKGLTQPLEELPELPDEEAAISDSTDDLWKLGAIGLGAYILVNLMKAPKKEQPSAKEQIKRPKL